MNIDWMKKPINSTFIIVSGISRGIPYNGTVEEIIECKNVISQVKTEGRYLYTINVDNIKWEEILCVKHISGGKTHRLRSALIPMEFTYVRSNGPLTSGKVSGEFYIYLLHQYLENAEMSMFQISGNLWTHSYVNFEEGIVEKDEFGNYYAILEGFGNLTKSVK